MTNSWSGSGTKDDPWQLQTPPGTSSYSMYRDDTADPPLLVCQVGSTRLTYLARVLDDLPEMLRAYGDWMPLGASDEKKPAAAGTVEAWGRAADNLVSGWYGQRKGYRGRLAMYVPPLLEALGVVELEHNARNNRVRITPGGKPNPQKSQQRRNRPTMSERQETTFTLRYSVERKIAAPPAALWVKLTDGPGFCQWNSTVDRLEGDIAVGSRLQLQVPIAPGRTFKPKVVALEPETQMVWQDGFFPMFQGTRTFTLSPDGDGTRFVMAETFRGLMLPMIKGSLPDFRPAFDQFADDLKHACEAG